MPEGIDFTNIFLYLSATFIGAIGGSYFTNIFRDKSEDKRLKKLRSGPESALDIIASYAPKSYKKCENHFNNSVNITDKRMFLVAFHKLGIPITLNDYKFFDINHVVFEDVPIDIEIINDIKNQISSGNCDNLFFIDPETYFNNDTLTKYKRYIANIFIDKVFLDTRLIKKNDDYHVAYPQDWDKTFSQREIDILGVFREKLRDRYYYDMATEVPKKGIVDKLHKEIDMGLWDDYLNLPYDAYSNMKLQQNVAQSAMYLCQNNLPNKNQFLPLLRKILWKSKEN